MSVEVVDVDWEENGVPVFTGSVCSIDGIADETRKGSSRREEVDAIADSRDWSFLILAMCARDKHGLLGKVGITSKQPLRLTDLMQNKPSRK